MYIYHNNFKYFDLLYNLRIWRSPGDTNILIFKRESSFTPVDYYENYCLKIVDVFKSKSELFVFEFKPLYSLGLVVM